MTDTSDALRAAFPDVAISHGRSVYFRITDAARVLDFIKARGWAVLGLEGFHAEGQRIRPDLDHIADLSQAGGSPDAAQRLIATWSQDPGLLVHLTVRGAG
jgi:hypothetical protein